MMVRQLIYLGSDIFNMVILMKKRILGLLIPIIVAVICGYVCGKFVYKTYKDSIYGDLRSSRIYLIESGKYDSYEEMREENDSNNYVYYVDDEGYKTVVGITKEYENVDKIKKIYSDNLYVDEYYIPIEYMNSKQDEYDNILKQKDDVYEIKEVVDNILNLYRSDDSIKLISLE